MRGLGGGAGAAPPPPPAPRPAPPPPPPPGSFGISALRVARLSGLQEGHRIEVVDVDDVEPGQAHLEGVHVVFEVDDFQASFL